MAAGEVSDPIQTDSGAAIVRVIDRKEVTPEGIAEGRQALRGELLNERKNRFYATYMAKARENMRINQNSAVLAQVVA